MEGRKEGRSERAEDRERAVQNVTRLQALPIDRSKRGLGFDEPPPSQEVSRRESTGDRCVGLREQSVHSGEDMEGLWWSWRVKRRAGL